MSIEGARHPDAFSLRPSDRGRTERASSMSVVEDGGADKVAELGTVGLVEAVDVERMGVVEHRAGRGCRCRRQDAPLALGVASRERVFKNDQGATSSERAPLRRLCSQTTASTGRPNAFMIFLGGGRALGSDARWLSATLGNSRWPGDPAESAYFAGCGPRYLPRGRWVEAANKRRLGDAWLLEGEQDFDPLPSVGGADGYYRQRRLASAEIGPNLPCELTEKTYRDGRREGTPLAEAKPSA
jgi:hypothetical protein